MGDPAGVGPELAVRTIQRYRLYEKADVIIYGSGAVIAEAKRLFAPDARFSVRETSSIAMNDFEIGVLSAKCGLAAYETVRAAALDCLSGEIDAMVTCPVNKAAVNLACIPFTGHTELVAELCKCRDFAMMQSAGSLRVIFATTHIPISQVPSALTRERIVTVGRLLHSEILEEGIKDPRIGVAALNPHAGENGNMGDEERLMIEPAVEDLRASGFTVEGPFPPDTLFIEGTRKRFDGIISMYHDQGHIPFKMLAFDRGVNSTLGIPVIRTSVDHGTAFDIAWKGTADTGSLHAAFEIALLRAENKKKS